MLEAIKFDFKRSWRSSTNVVIFAAFLILMLGTFFTAVGTKDTSSADTYSTFVSASDAVQKTIKVLKKVKSPDAPTKALLARKETQLTYVQDLVLAGANMTNPMVQGSQRAVTKAELKYAEYNLAQTKAGHAAELTLLSFKDQPVATTLLARKQDVTFYKYLLAHRIKEVAVSKTDAPAVNYVTNTFLYRLSPLLFLALFAVQWGTMFTSDKRDGTISFVNNVPVSKITLVTARMIVGQVITIPLAVGAIATTFVITGLKFGWGSWQYPLVYAPTGTTVAIMTAGQFLTTFCLLLLLNGVFLMFLSVLVSLISGQMAVNLVVSALVILAGTPSAAGAAGIKAVAQFLPSSYFNTQQVILHQTTWPIMSIAAGAVLIGVWCVVFYGVSAGILQHRERI